MCVSGRIDLAGENVSESSWGPAPGLNAPSHAVPGQSPSSHHLLELLTGQPGHREPHFPVVPLLEPSWQHHAPRWLPAMRAFGSLSQFWCSDLLGKVGKQQALRTDIAKAQLCKTTLEILIRHPLSSGVTHPCTALRGTIHFLTIASCKIKP